jgi:hypothetical protein
MNGGLVIVHSKLLWAEEGREAFGSDITRKFADALSKLFVRMQILLGDVWLLMWMERVT